MAVESDGRMGPDAATVLGYLGITVYLLTALLGLSLLFVGTIAIIAELKGTWHWSIHLRSSLSYTAVFVSRLLLVLGPLFVILVVGRAVIDDA